MTPAVRQLLMGGGSQWRSTLPAVRAFVTANYNQPNPHNQAAMAVPPTITASTTQPAGLTFERRYLTDQSLRFYGGESKTYGTTYRRGVVATEAATGGNADDGQSAISWRATILANAQKVSVRVLGTPILYRFIVDGQYVDVTGSEVSNTVGGTNYFQLDFGTKTVRTVTAEIQAAAAFDGFGCAPGDTLVAVATTPRRFIVLGDSFIGSTGAAARGDGCAIVAGDMLGFADTWQSGVGSTGYVNTASGTKFNLAQRLGDVTRTGPWDVIAVAMGLNDIGQPAGLITAEASYCLTTIRKRCPGAQIFVVGPWDTAAPSAVAAAYTTTKAAIRAGIPANMGITFLDPEGVTYTKFDATHPDTAGHATLGAWLALQIKTALGA